MALQPDGAVGDEWGGGMGCGAVQLADAGANGDNISAGGAGSRGFEPGSANHQDVDRFGIVAVDPPDGNILYGAGGTRRTTNGELECENWNAVLRSSFPGWETPAEFVVAQGKTLDQVLEIRCLEAASARLPSWAPAPASPPAIPVLPGRVTIGGAETPLLFWADTGVCRVRAGESEGEGGCRRCMGAPGYCPIRLIMGESASNAPVLKVGNAGGVASGGTTEVK